MKKNVKLLIVCILLPLTVGALSALASGSGAASFATLNKPPLSPPAWVFPVVWTLLYILMGIASYLVLAADAPKLERSRALRTYILQLFFNYGWSILFFGQGLLFASFVWLLALLAFVILCTVRFFALDKTSGYLLLPYILWVSFAGYLNLAFALIN